MILICLIQVFHAMIANIYTSGSADYTASSIVYGAKEYWEGKEMENLNKIVLDYGLHSLGHKQTGLQVLLEQFNEMVKNNHPSIKVLYYSRWVLYLRIDKQPANEHSKFFKLEEDRKIGGAVDCRFWQTGKAKLYDYKTMTSTSLILEDKIKDFAQPITQVANGMLLEIQYLK